MKYEITSNIRVDKVVNDMIEKEKLIKLTLTGTGLETVLVLCTEFA